MQNNLKIHCFPGKGIHWDFCVGIGMVKKSEYQDWKGSLEKWGKEGCFFSQTSRLPSLRNYCNILFREGSQSCFAKSSLLQEGQEFEAKCILPKWAWAEVNFILTEKKGERSMKKKIWWWDFFSSHALHYDDDEEEVCRLWCQWYRVAFHMFSITLL